MTPVRPRAYLRHTFGDRPPSVVNYTYLGNGNRMRWLGVDLLVLFDDNVADISQRRMDHVSWV